MRVEIGGGPEPLYRDWVQYDLINWFERTGLYYVIGDIRALPWAEESVEEIFASNVLEHVGFRETVPTLQEWRRVLRPGGRLTVVVPDLLGIFNDFKSGLNSWEDFVIRVYGGQTYELDLHRAGFTTEQMPQLFQQAGLHTDSCESTHAGGGVTIVGHK